VRGGVDPGLRVGVGKAEQESFYLAAENVVRKRLEVEVQADEDDERKNRREVGHVLLLICVGEQRDTCTRTCAHSHTHRDTQGQERRRERESARAYARKREKETHTRAHTGRERESVWERGRQGGREGGDKKGKGCTVHGCQSRRPHHAVKLAGDRTGTTYHY
jgi:hypothetical protein